MSACTTTCRAISVASTACVSLSVLFGVLTQVHYQSLHSSPSLSAFKSNYVQPLLITELFPLLMAFISFVTAAILFLLSAIQICSCVYTGITEDQCYADVTSLHA